VSERVHSAKEPQPSANPLFDNQVLTYRDLVTRLQIPLRTLERLVSKDEIPHKRFGYHVRFYWPDVLDWLRNQKGTRTR
jgi:excisionase family DNA binding protein